MHSRRVNLQRRIWLTFWSAAALPPLLALALLRDHKEAIAIFWVLAWTAGARWTSRWIGRAFVVRAFHQLQRALDHEDGPRARRVIEDVASAVGSSPAGADYLSDLEGAVLLVEERWSEARAIYEELARTELPGQSMQRIRKNLAWALVHSGDAERAVVLTQDLIDAEPPELRRSVLGTHGAALVLVGRPAEAARVLQGSIALGGSQGQLAAFHYYLGEALAALGRHDEAHPAYRTAAQHPTRFGLRARDRLARGVPPPHR